MVPPSRLITAVALALITLGAHAAEYDPNNDPKRPIAKTPSLTPEGTAKALQLPAGFSVQLVAGEPDVHQPVGYTMDDRGRLWVLECSNYPVSPGKPVDRILILEDTDHDGRADKKTVFYDKLTFATGIQVGHGGVWVGAPPNLLFFPDRDGDDKPDGEPEKVLDGWGAEDTHETLNNFVWGPDGWLYGTQGIFTHSKVGKPGTPEAERIPINAGVWRYHPTKRVFERYAEGASNQWGIDWNDRGQAFFAACVIPHMWQCIQGARYHRQAGKHFNPHTYDDIKTIGDFEYEKRAYCGAMVYLGGQFPQEFRDTFFFNDIHMNKMRNERMVRNGSGYKAERNIDFVVSKDPWYRGLSPQYGPDGSVFLNDWYDKVPCHQQKDQTDRTNGRLYKLVFGQPEKIEGLDLKKATDAELVEMQLSKNDWFVRHARRILQERGPNQAVHEALVKIFRDNPDDTRQLRALWSLHVTQGLTESVAMEALSKESEYVRGWAIQLLCEDSPSEAVLKRLAEMAASDKSPLVRLYLASAAQRIPIVQRWPILNALVAHEEDAADHNIPLMVWYAAEPAVAADPAKAAELLAVCKIAKVQEFIARRMASLAAN